MTTFVLVRHGQTEWNRVERFRGRSDIPLNETGRTQAEALARTLSSLPIAAIYTSPLERAKQTGETIARRLGLTVQPTEGLLDIDYGTWEGLTPREAETQFPTLYENWLKEPHLVEFPGGESLAQVRGRALQVVDDLAEQHQGQVVVLVGHKILNKVLLCAVLGLDDSHIWQIEQDEAAINLFSRREGAFRLLLCNDTCHLAATEAAAPVLKQALREERSIRQEYLIKASPEVVFRDLTDPKELTKWFLRRAEIDLRVGGRIFFLWDHDSHEGKILQLLPPQKISYTWPTMGWGGTPQADTVVTFTLEPWAGVTILKLEHTGFGRGQEWVEYYASTREGWAYYFQNLKSVLETGYDLRKSED